MGKLFGNRRSFRRGAKCMTPLQFEKTQIQEHQQFDKGSPKSVTAPRTLWIAVGI
jgi:hypothetical protein